MWDFIILSPGLKGALFETYEGKELLVYGYKSKGVIC